MAGLTNRVAFASSMSSHPLSSVMIALHQIFVMSPSPKFTGSVAEKDAIEGIVLRVNVMLITLLFVKLKLVEFVTSLHY